MTRAVGGAAAGSPAPATCVRALCTPPNAVSLARLLAIPALWWLALAGEAEALGWGVLLAASSDAVDGWLARRLGQVTTLGARLDSLADNLLIPSVAAWLLMFAVELRTIGNATALAAGVLVWAAYLAIAWCKFGRLGNLHLWTAKFAAVVGMAWAFWTLAVGFSQWLFVLAIAASIVCSVEGVLILISRDQVHEHIGSILRPGSAAPACRARR